ncbi:MAG: exosortase H [bacterium]
MILWHKISSFFKKNKTILRFYLLLGFFILLLFLLLHNRYSYKYLAEYIPTILARITAGLISFLGGEVTVAGKLLSGKKFSMRIIYDCSGIFVTVIYVAAVLAYPTTAKKIGLGLLIGIPVLNLINIFRMVFMFYVGQYLPNYISLFHTYLWQGMFIILVLLLWLFWVEKIVHGYEK